jgi:hypothetical protein
MNKFQKPSNSKYVEATNRFSGFVVLKAMNLENDTFWNMTPCERKKFGRDYIASFFSIEE